MRQKSHLSSVAFEVVSGAERRAGSSRWKTETVAPSIVLHFSRAFADTDAFV